MCYIRPGERPRNETTQPVCVVLAHTGSYGCLRSLGCSEPFKTCWFAFEENLPIQVHMRNRNKSQFVIALIVALLIFLLPITIVDWLAAKNPYNWDIEWQWFRKIILGVS